MSSACYLLHASFLGGLFFHHENEGGIFLLNAGHFSVGIILLATIVVLLVL
jgi:hypothetical protein